MVFLKHPVAGEIHLAFLYELMDQEQKTARLGTKYQVLQQESVQSLHVAADHQIIV